MAYIGTLGNDTLSTNAQFGETVYYGLDGNDQILFGVKTGEPGTLGPVYINGGVGNDILTGNLARDTLIGDVGDDLILANGGDDLVEGGLGEDTINGFADNDQISGGAGDDRIEGGDGADTLDGGLGDDTLSGGSGAQDFFFGGGGHDIVTYDGAGGAVSLDLEKPAQSSGDAAGDVFESIEEFTGSNVADAMKGAGGTEIFNGSGGADTLDGRGGGDNLSGDFGADLILGGAGDDFITGGDSDDTLVGGTGADFMSGDAGADTFRFLSVKDSGVSGTKRDQIDGLFDGDRLDFKAIDAIEKTGANDAFKIDTGGAFKVGEIRILERIDEVIVQLNTRGDDTPEMSIVLFNSGTLTAGDFLL